MQWVQILSTKYLTEYEKIWCSHSDTSNDERKYFYPHENETFLSSSQIQSLYEHSEREREKNWLSVKYFIHSYSILLLCIFFGNFPTEMNWNNEIFFMNCNGLQKNINRISCVHKRSLRIFTVDEAF